MKKTRKPGGGRKKLKPEYDAGKNLKEQMDAAVALYEEDCSLQSIANALKLNPIKVRKLLITAGVYESEVAEKVKNTFEESDLAWKREWEAKVREKARQEQARQEQRERQPKRKKRSYDMSL